MNNTVEPAIDTGVMILSSPPEDAQVIPDTVRVEGYFNGDTSRDIGYGVFYGRINSDKPHEEGMEVTSETQYVVRFQDNKIKPMPVVIGRHIRLVNEGDLNGDGEDDISVFVQSMHACMYTCSTWSYIAGRWVRITEYWDIPTACDYLSDEDLESRIEMEDGELYYYETDINDKDFPLVKKELTLIR
ncbi:hypothetical protein L3C95_00205 [Chitinophaga filiformis]|uniref:hypothetical protein n=1 Tax=Chitinophaga filiformis TaxID=104663 RepID=UPI001F35417E|nr:hypothetical protein [Chitinophaga filiformis]MCF6401274.1 hypothetical protein [Chitinophaga filiformis]